MIIPWTAKRQITYFLVFVLIVSAIVFFIWSRAIKPTCFDNKQNQSENGIDCGGPCNKKCLGDVKELIVLWSNFFEISKDKYDVAVLVKNPNLFLSVSSLKYQFKIYDKDNILIAVKEGETFITPGETFPIFETNVDVGLRTPGRVFIEFEKSSQWERSEKEKLSLVVSKKQFFNEPPFPRLAVTLENKFVVPVYNIFVAAILYDKDKNVQGVSITKIDAISGESSEEIVFTWPQIFSEELSPDILFKTSL